MVKQTIIVRVRDGMSLAKGPRNENEENDVFSSYKQQRDFILQEISRGDLPSSNMTICVDELYSFRIMVESGICFMTLCDLSYPRDLAFLYLQDLQRQFDKLDKRFVEGISNPYCSIPKLGAIISNVREKYVDPRTQSNISKMMKSKMKGNLDAVTYDLSEIIERRQKQEMWEKMKRANLSEFKIRGSKKLEIIAMKWMPIATLIVVVVLLLWSSSLFKDEFW
ncbi:hypothetical protein DM860_015404 [Cuscuta australis]|uniref:Longin domain-containing protein n=1 Tax=Cuscuta australis TaxID=267555 RepID=A0A328DQ79_9ASTE|nr:hypothetical protein DM860_015404 [Cuscuta australis]